MRFLYQFLAKKVPRPVLAGLTSICLIASVTSAKGKDIGAGRQFAEQNCARCHAIGRSGESPFKPAPAFRTFARLWPLESLQEALAEGIVVGHPAMPEFTLTPRQIDNFIGYLKTVQTK